MKVFQALVMAGLAVLPSLAYADIVVFKDNRIVEVKVLSQDSREVVVLDKPSDPKSQRRLARAEVDRVILTNADGSVVKAQTRATRPAILSELPREPAAPPIEPASSGAGYCLIPLHGQIGGTVAADILEKSLADAEARKPSAVILDVDSPGGDIEEAQRIIKVLNRYRKRLRIIVLAEEDLSAAAIITLSIKEIYIKPSGIIGAATAVGRDSSGAPVAVGEKLQSTWRAIARSSAETGGHEPLLAQAMIDNQMELYLSTVDGKKVVRTERSQSSDKRLIRKGQILTLTGREAMECGLASGLADDAEDLGKAVGMPGWKERKCIAPLLAAFQRERIDFFLGRMKTLSDQFKADVKAAVAADPSAGVYLKRVTTIIPQIVMTPVPGPTYIPNPYPHVPQVPQPYIPGRPGMHPYGPRGPQPYVPGRPSPYGPGGVPVAPRPYISSPPITTGGSRVVTSESIEVPDATKAKWKDMSLSCVVSLQKAEDNLAAAIELCEAYDTQLLARRLKNIQDELAVVRSEVYRNRGKFENR